MNEKFITKTTTTTTIFIAVMTKELKLGKPLNMKRTYIEYHAEYCGK
jgi:hypothetical protein